MKNQGMTLIELVITMTLMALLFSVVGLFMRFPILSYANVVNGAVIVDDAEIALQRMRYDLQSAVPTSVRWKVDPSNAQRIALEFLNGVEYIPYAQSGPNNFSAGTPLSAINTLGLFSTAPTNATCAANNCRIIVDNNDSAYFGNTDSPSAGLNVYSTGQTGGGAVTITPPGTTVTFSTSGSQAVLTFNSPVTFANLSPSGMLYVSDSPVTYICDTGAGTLNRYWGYTIAQVQPTNPSVAPLSTASEAPLSNNVTACSFNTVYPTSPGSPYQIVNLTLTFGYNSQTVTLMRQITVANPI